MAEWQVNGTPDTLTSSGDTMTISDLESLTFNAYLEHEIDTGGANTKYTINNDTGVKYARRFSDNGAEGTAVNETNSGTHDVANAGDTFIVGYAIAISGEEILVMDWSINQQTAGAGNAPLRKVMAWKSTVSPPITRMDANNDAAGSYDIDANFSVLGTN